MIEHAVEHKSKRFQQNQRELEFMGLFKDWRRIGWNQRAVPSSTRFLLELEASMSQAFGQCDFRKRGKVAKSADTPAPKGLQKLLGGVRIRFISEQHFQRQATQNFGFLSLWDNGYAAEAVRGQQSGL